MLTMKISIILFKEKSLNYYVAALKTSILLITTGHPWWYTNYVKPFFEYD